MRPAEDASPLRDPTNMDSQVGELRTSKPAALGQPQGSEKEHVDGLPSSPGPYVAGLSATPAPSSPNNVNEINDHGGGGADGNDDLMAKIFQFLSTATPETLGAIAVGLAAITYFILGQVGLLLIGAFGGVVLFISWEARNPDVSLAVKGEKGRDALARILDLKDGVRGGGSPHGSHGLEEDEADSKESGPLQGFEDLQPETRDALNALVDAVIRDYVKWWYTPIMPLDRSFPLSCRKVLTSFLLSVSNRLSRKRPAETFLDFLTNSSSIIIVFFSELSAALSVAPSDGSMSAPDAINKYLASNQDSNLANLLNQRQQAAKFRMVSEDLLEFLDRSTYDCDPARVFLREILAGVILEMTLKSCSKPEWINGWIVYLLEAGEPDFSQAIDVGMQNNSLGDVNGNTGSIPLTKGSRNSVDTEKARRKEATMSHKKKLSRADEEMEEAMEEIKRLNQMIAEEDARRARESATSADAEGEQTSLSTAATAERAESAECTETAGDPTSSGAAEASSRLADAMKRNANDLDIQPDIYHKTGVPRESNNTTSGPVSPSSVGVISPKGTSGDEMFGRRDSVQTPLTPRSLEMETPSLNPSPQHTSFSGSAKQGTHGIHGTQGMQFTSFDQLVPPTQEDNEASDSSEAARNKQQQQQRLTLHNATITIHDDGMSQDKNRIRNKPGWDYLIQIEPASSHHPGWMIVRKYTDFERLHEVLSRIARISGATSFEEQHDSLPSWKVHNKASLRGELERYARDACWYQPLAESEGMRRFLEKDMSQQQHARGPSKTGFEAFENMGKNVLGVLTSAPKGVAEGGKVVVGGVTGVLGNIGLGARRSTNSSLQDVTGNAASTSAVSSASSSAKRLSMPTPPPQTRTDSGLSVASIQSSGAGMGAATNAAPRKARDSLDSQRSSVVSSQPSKVAPMERRPSYQSQGEPDSGGLQPSRQDRWEGASPTSGRSSRQHSRASSMAPPLRSPSATSLSGIKLPPPPSEMPDDYRGPNASGGVSGGDKLHRGGSVSNPNKVPSQPQPRPQSQPPSRPLSLNCLPADTVAAAARKQPASRPARQFAPLSEQEASVAVELMFAVITELYTLSSAWNIRRTLLAAAKSFLLRPGNPSLESVRSVVQSSVLDANTSDGAVAAHLRRLRENSLPTEEELAAWPAEMTPEEKERLRAKARGLLIQSGVPAALSGVMGQSATGAALGRVFDCLQVEEVARGLIFGLMLQAVRVITH